MHTSLYDYCVKQGEEALLRQWDGEKSGDLRPEDITYGSKRKVWWRCEKGHSWQASVCSRAGDGAGCPYCTGRRPMPGETDLASQFPDIAAQWHPSKNLPLTPEEMLPAAGQGILAVQGRAGEDTGFLADFNDPVAEACAYAERSFVRHLDGGCSDPIAAHAIPDVGHGTLRLLGFFHDEKSESTFKEEATGSIKQAEALGAAVAGRILAACRG